jgi:hypothetical protein
MTQHSNQKSKSPKGKPSSIQGGGSGLKGIANDQQLDESIEEKYLDDQGELNDDVVVKHTNRNTDKGREDQGSDTRAI